MAGSGRTRHGVKGRHGGRVLGIALGVALLAAPGGIPGVVADAPGAPPAADLGLRAVDRDPGALPAGALPAADPGLGAVGSLSQEPLPPIELFGGHATCTAEDRCGPFTVGPIALLGNATCTGGEGCGYVGTGPVSIFGNATCEVEIGCGTYGTGPVSVTGDARCRAGDGCGSFGTGPVSVTGDVECEGTCGRGDPGASPVVRRGTPGITVTGEAQCNRPFDHDRAANPSQAAGEVRQSECVSLRGETPPLPVPSGIYHPVETLVVDSRVNDANRPARSVTPLAPGVRYLIVAEGRYRFGENTDGVEFLDWADAECSTQFRQSWLRYRFPLPWDPDGDLLDLYVNAAPVDWVPWPGTAVPAEGGTAGCSLDHIYFIEITGGGQTAAFHIYDLNHLVNDGQLTVTIWREVA